MNQLTGSGMDDGLKPIVMGYIQHRPLMSATEMYEIQGKIIRLALSKGLEVGALFIEREAMSRSAFDSAFAKLDTYGPRYLIIPGIDHLDHIGGSSAFTLVEDLTARGIEVLIVA